MAEFKRLFLEARVRTLTLGWVLPLGTAVACAQGMQAPEDEVMFQRFKDLLTQKVNIASRLDQRLRDAPAVVSIVRQEELRLHGWRRLSDVLEQIPGFSTRWQAGGDQGLAVRGMFAPDGVLVMVDGISINDPLNGNVSFYDFPLEGIERIEIARGPGSALYGGYAFLAVINLITVPAEPSKKAAGFEADGGVRRSYDAQGHFEGPFRWGELKVFAGLHRLRDQKVTVPNDLITSLIRRTTVGDRATDRYNAIATDDDERDFRSKQADVGAHVKVSQGPLAGLSVDTLYTQKRTSPFLSRLYALVDQGLLERRDDLFHLGVAMPWEISDTFRITSRLYETSIYGRSAGQITRPYGWDDDEDFDGITERWPGGRVEARSYLFHTLGAEVSASIAAFPLHTLNAGALIERTWLARTQYLTNSSRLSSGVEVSFGDGRVVDAQVEDPKQNQQDSWIYTGRDGKRIIQDIHRNLGALYLQDIWTFNPKVSATLGLRFDNFSGFGSALSPRAVVVWNLSDKAYVKALYGEAFKPPTFLALYDGTVTLKNERQVYGNPALKITTIRTGEVAMGYQFSSVLLAQANVFLTRTRDEVVFNSDAEEYRNEASRKTRGLELELQGVWDARRVYLSYAFNNAVMGQGSGAPLYPKHQINLGCELSNLFRRLDLGTTLIWRSAYPREPGDVRRPLGSSTILQANLAVRLSRRISFTLGGSNLLNQDWRSPVDKTLAGVLPGDIPRQGRSVEAGLNVRF